METKIKANSHLTREYKKLVSEISEISGIVFHLGSIFEKYLKSYNKQELKKFNISFLGGQHFTYRSPYDGKLFFGGSYSWELKNNINKIEIIKRKTNNYFVAVAYEFFESFLRSITARIIVFNPFIVNHDPNLGFRSYDSCYLFLKNNYKYRDNMTILKLLQSINPRFKSTVNSHRNISNYLHLFSTYIKCRNHIVHTDGVISRGSYEKFGHTNQKFAKDWFGVKLFDKKNKYLIDTSKRGREIMSAMVELAYLIISSFDQSFVDKIKHK